MLISNNDYDSVFDDIQYTNIFTNNKLIKMTFITERKYYYKLKTFIIKKYINSY